MVLSSLSGKVYFSFKLWISCVKLAYFSSTLHICSSCEFPLYSIRSLALSEQITRRIGVPLEVDQVILDIRQERRKLFIQTHVQYEWRWNGEHMIYEWNCANTCWGENGSKYSKTLFAEGLSKHQHLLLLTGHTRIHLPKPINARMLQKYRNQHSTPRERLPTFL